MKKKSTVTGRPETIGLPEELLVAFAKYIQPAVQKFYDSEEGRQYYKSFVRNHPDIIDELDTAEWNNLACDEDDDW